MINWLLIFLSFTCLTAVIAIYIMLQKCFNSSFIWLVVLLIVFVCSCKTGKYNLHHTQDSEMEITQNYDILLTNNNFSKPTEKILNVEKEVSKSAQKKEKSLYLPKMASHKSGKKAKNADSSAYFSANKSPGNSSVSYYILPQKKESLIKDKNIYLYAIIIAALLGIALLLIGSFTALRLLYLAGLLLIISVIFVASNIWDHRKGERKLLYNNFRKTAWGAFFGSILLLGIILLITYFATVTLLSLVIVYVLSLLLLVTTALFLGSALAWLIMYLTEYKKPAQ